jgi:RimJ/RimL family protein N-acetyltransferase
MIFCDTQRLTLRALEREELPRLVALLGVWDVVRWLSVVPFPYTLRDAQDFYDDIAPHNATQPQFYALSLKADGLLIGGAGLHPPRTADARPGEIEIGYWLAQDYWGRGLMSEACAAVIENAFARPGTSAVVATTDPGNRASQNVLRKAGLDNLGLGPRTYATLRGGDQIIGWRLDRATYEANKNMTTKNMAGAA